MAETKSYIESYITPEDVEYWFRDAEAQERLDAISDTVSGVMHWEGETTTALTDNATTATIKIDGTDRTFKNTADDKGSVVSYGGKEFAWNGTKWQEFGSTGSLKALAFKDSATSSYKPQGSVSKPTFSGTAGTVTVKGTPAGTVSAADNTSGNYQPKGTVSAPTISVKTAGATAKIKGMASVGTLPTMTVNVTDKKLKITFNQGTLPTQSAEQTFKTGDAAYQAASPTFTGTKVQLDFTGTETSSTGSFTPAGTVSQPTFTGTNATITVS